MKLWHIQVAWGYGTQTITVRAWSKAGAIRAAYAKAALLKPQADVKFIGVSR